MKGKRLILFALMVSVSLLPACSLFGWTSSEPAPAPQEPAPVVVQAPVEPAPPPAPAKPMTTKQRRAAEAKAKKEAEIERKKAASRPKVKDSVEVVQTKLDTFAKSHVASANRTLRPNKQNMEVRKDGSGYVAFYSEVDEVTLKTELYPSNSPGCQYVGHVVYIENVIASSGTTEKAARTGVFKQIKSKRIRELTRYDNGKWYF